MSSIREAQRLAALEAWIAKLEARLSEAPRLDFDRPRAGNARPRPGRASTTLKTGREETSDHA